jgi:aspartate/methionine/tyrosine aminotransferase
MRYADRMANLGTETAFEVLARARALEAQGRDIVHLEIGEPDFDTPKHIIEEAVSALRGGWTHYGPSAGLPEARDAVARYVARTRGIPVERDNVVITPGGKPVMFYAILACVNPGDEVIYPNPGFPIYESVVRYFGAVPVPIPLREENDWRMDMRELLGLITPRTRMIILNSPHNPTGSTLPKGDLVELAQRLDGTDIFVLSDEIYSRIIYDGAHASIASLPGMQDRTIILDGWSKTWAMTGWRLGYGVMNVDLAKHMARLMTNSNSCTASFAQRAAIVALEGPQDDVEKMCAEFRARRDLIVSGLNAIPGVSCKTPTGAFYVFPNVKQFGGTSAQIADMLLGEAGIAALTGTAFGAHGEGYLRFSYATSRELILEGLKRLAATRSGAPA